MQLKFGDKREVGEEQVGVLPVSKKEGKWQGKNGIGPRMKNGRANLEQNEAFTVQFCREAKWKKANTYYSSLG